MKSYSPTYRAYGGNAVLIDWPQIIDIAISTDVMSFFNAIEKEDVEGVLDVSHAYASLMIRFDQDLISIAQLTDRLQSLYLATKSTIEPSRIWHIPVCYSRAFGLDLSTLAKNKKCTEEEVVKWHLSCDYRVYFIGFLPGFLYLGGLDERLYQKRKATPNLKTPAGSVGIGGEQTGVYPVESPGGWHIIGRTPVKFFNSGLENPCFARPNDQIRFFAIDDLGYERISKAVYNDEYEINCS